MKKSDKTQNYYLCGEEAEKEVALLTQKLEELNKEIDELQKKYVEIGNSQLKSKKKYRLLHKLEKREIHTKAKAQSVKIDLIHLEKGTYRKLNIIQKVVKKIKNLSYQQQKVVCGLLFLLPWFIGFCIFFFKPLITTIWWSFNKVTPEAGHLTISFNGIENYISIFTKTMFGTRTFLEILTVSVQEMLLNVPIILIFSLLIAVVLNTKFKGHQLLKAVFFIPVIYNSTIISTVLNGTFGDYMSGSGANSMDMLESFASYLLQIGLAEDLIKFLIDAVDRIFTIVNMSGIQIIIFIAALQSIPRHLYEAAKVEGATTYECFWKITFPMVSPMFLPIIVYTIVDSFAGSDLIHFMTKQSEGIQMAYGLSSAVAVIYFLVNIFVIMLVFLILRKVVYKND